MAELRAPGLTWGRRSAKGADVTLFTQELSWLIAAGIPLGRAIDLLLADAQDSAMAPALRTMRADLRAGRSLAQALGAHPALFPAAYVRLVALAETAGTLPQVLERLHLARAHAEALRRKVRGALIYPAFLVLVALAAIAVLLLAVVPQLRAIAPAGAEGAGALTRLLAVSDWITRHGAAVAGILALGVLALTLALRRPAVQRAGIAVLARLPVVGPVIRTFRLAEVLRTLAMLTEAGLPFADALRLGRTTTPAPDLARAIGDMESALRAGGDIAAPLRASGLFPQHLISLIRVGMETGSMAQSLRQAAQIFDEKTRHATDRALTLLEPAIILMISVVVGGIIYVIVDALLAVNDLLI